jgi:xylan 1,4-beta-xylosidase
MHCLRRSHQRCLLCFAVLFAYCSPNTFTQAGQRETENILLADPTIFYNNGTYYLYGTGGNEYNQGFPVYSSSDLKTWTGPVGKNQGYALKKGDAFGDNKFWAPQVFQYQNNFYMAYAASEHIGIATSDSPLGPFASKTLQSIPAETKQIDPYVFVDNDGKKYLYYVAVANGGNRIYVVELQEDMLSVKKETATLCIEATEKWENTDPQYSNWPVIEGPTVIRHNNLYYLVYSANHFKSIDYAVGYATSTSPLGPWKKYEGSPIIHRSITGENGSGHGDLVQGKNNDWLYVFHTHNSAEKIAPRKTAIIAINFVKDTKTGLDKLVAQPGSFKYLWQPKHVK